MKEEKKEKRRAKRKEKKRKERKEVTFGKRGGEDRERPREERERGREKNKLYWREGDPQKERILWPGSAEGVQPYSKILESKERKGRRLSRKRGEGGQRKTERRERDIRLKKREKDNTKEEKRGRERERERARENKRERKREKEREGKVRERGGERVYLGETVSMLVQVLTVCFCAWRTECVNNRVAWGT